MTKGKSNQQKVRKDEAESKHGEKLIKTNHFRLCGMSLIYATSRKRFINIVTKGFTQ